MPFSAAKRSPPPRPKMSVDLAAVGADEAGHVLDQTEYGHAHALEHGQRLGYVGQSHLLGRRHQDGAGERHRLGQRQLGVRGAGRQIHDQVVEVAPVDVAEELLDRAAHQRARAIRPAGPRAGRTGSR